MHHPLTRSLFAACVAAALCISAAGQDAQAKPAVEAATPAKAAAAKPAPVTAQSSGVRIFKDPETGAIREPDAQEVQAMQRTTRARSRAVAARPQFIQGPKGTLGLQLTEENMVSEIAVKNPDGSISFKCAEGKTRADQVLRQPVQASKELLDEK